MGEGSTRVQSTGNDRPGADQTADFAGQTAPPIAPHTPELKKHSWRWPIAITLIVLILATAGVALVTVNRLGQIADNFRLGITPQTTKTTAITSTAFRVLADKPKLVVMTASLDVMITKSSQTRVFWGKLDLGTTIVEVRANGNRVQFIVPMEELEQSDLSYDELTNTLTVRAPAPRIDDQVVDVQSNPEKIDIQTDNGWLKLDRYSGEPLREEAKTELRSAVVKQANKPMLQEQARGKAARVIENLLRSPLVDVGDDIKIDVIFKELPEQPVAVETSEAVGESENPVEKVGRITVQTFPQQEAPPQ